MSIATINKELRYIRAALRVAYDWEYVTRVPKIRFLKQPKKLPTFVPPDHFAAIYRACDAAYLPDGIPNLAPSDWWRGILVTAYMTGWRVAQILALQWEDVDLDNKTALSRAEDNKGRRDVEVPLHPVVVDHLSKLTASFDTHVFPWNHNRRTLWTQFQHIQRKSELSDGSAMPREGKDGRWYGFHDLRRAFATKNAAEMDLFELQALMQHKSLETTRGYVSMAKRLNKVVDHLFVPDVLKSAGSA